MSTISKRIAFPARRLAWAMLGGVLVGGLFLSGGCSAKTVDGGPAVLPKAFPGGRPPSAARNTAPQPPASSGTHI